MESKDRDMHSAHGYNFIALYCALAIEGLDFFCFEFVFFLLLFFFRSFYIVFIVRFPNEQPKYANNRNIWAWIMWKMESNWME